MNRDRPSPSSSHDRPLLHGVDWAVHTGVTEEVMAGARQRFRRRQRRRFALAGATGALVLGAALWFSSFARPAATVTGVPASAVVAVPARQILPDGTIVELKTDAEIAVAYSPAARRVVLIRGEAHFQVVKDQTRPFIVAVDSVEVRAVGTAFSVQRHQAQVEVLVTTGRVAVDRVGKNAADIRPPLPETVAMLDAGNRTLVAVASHPIAPVVETVSEIEIGRHLAWRIPRLEFTRTPLAEAIPMINRHSAIKLSLGDPGLGSVCISGMLRVDNVESLFRLLEIEHGIKSEHRSTTEVILRSGR